MSTDEGEFLYELEVEVESEIAIVQSSHPEGPDSSPNDWLYDPTDREREEVGLRNMIDAVEALEATRTPMGASDRNFHLDGPTTVGPLGRWSD